jgi:flavodoxin
MLQSLHEAIKNHTIIKRNMRYRLYSTSKQDATRKTDFNVNVQEAHGIEQGDAMNIRVVFHTVTENTKKVARSIAAALDTNAEAIDSAVLKDGCDLLVLGASIYGGKIHQSVIEFIRTLDPKKVKRIALFSTGFSDKAIGLMKAIINQIRIPIVSPSFTCKGRFLFFNFGHPNSKDLESAQDFARTLKK